jgi:hypothetical protein
MSKQLAKLETVEIQGGGRYYRSPTNGMWYPSVTTVVNHQDAEKWKKWREDPDNKAHSEKALARGNRLHQLVEDYLMDQRKPTELGDRYYFDPMLPYLKNIEGIYTVETALWSDSLNLAGRVDCIGKYKGMNAVIDFKTAGKEKKREWIRNYFHQAAAYSYMWQERTEEVAEAIVILIVNDEGTVQEFIEHRTDHVRGLGEVMKSFWLKNPLSKIQGVANGLAAKAA